MNNLNESNGCPIAFFQSQDSNFYSKFGNSAGVLCPRNQLIPFCFSVELGGSPNFNFNWSLISLETGIETSLNDLLIKIYKDDSTDRYYFKYFGDADLSIFDFDCGLYIMKFDVGGGSVFSESLRIFDPNGDDQVFSLTYNHSSNLFNCPFENRFEYRLYFFGGYDFRNINKTEENQSFPDGSNLKISSTSKLILPIAFVEFPDSLVMPISLINDHDSITLNDLSNGDSMEIAEINVSISTENSSITGTFEILELISNKRGCGNDIPVSEIFIG